MDPLKDCTTPQSAVIAIQSPKSRVSLIVTSPIRTVWFSAPSARLRLARGSYSVLEGAQAALFLLLSFHHDHTPTQGFVLGGSKS